MKYPAPIWYRKPVIEDMAYHWFESLVYNELVEALEDNDLIIPSGISEISWRGSRMNTVYSYGALFAILPVKSNMPNTYVYCTIKRNGHVGFDARATFNGKTVPLKTFGIKYFKAFKVVFMDRIREALYYANSKISKEKKKENENVLRFLPHV